MSGATGDGSVHDMLAAEMVRHSAETAKALGKMATELAVMNERLSRIDDHEIRLRVVEREHITKKAALATAGLLIPFVTTILAFTLGKVFS